MNLRFSFAGLATIFREEYNVRIFAVVGGIGNLIGLALAFPRWGLALLIFSWISTLSLELMNSAIERAIDIVQPDRDDRVEKIKDISSASVFLTGLFYVCLWAYLFVNGIH